MSRSHVTSGSFHLLTLIIALVAAQALGEQRTVYTESELQTAVPMGIPGVRTWADAPLSVLRTQVTQLAALDTGHSISVLALSGGGEHGAFGAGLLNGWSESGRRPTFDVVTGVSTGAWKQSTLRCQFIVSSAAIHCSVCLVKACTVRSRSRELWRGRLITSY
jgi:hypothetical protein